MVRLLRLFHSQKYQSRTGQLTVFPIGIGTYRYRRVLVYHFGFIVVIKIQGSTIETIATILDSTKRIIFLYQFPTQVLPISLFITDDYKNKI